MPIGMRCRTRTYALLHLREVQLLAISLSSLDVMQVIS